MWKEQEQAGQRQRDWNEVDDEDDVGGQASMARDNERVL